MARFRFRLEILLKLALNKEEEAKKDLAIWQKRKTEALESLRNTETEIAEAAIEKALKKNIQDILLYEYYLERLRKEKIRKENELEYVTKELQKALLHLAETIKKRKILEKLKEKKFEQYVQNMDAAEQKELDEIGTTFFKESR